MRRRDFIVAVGGVAVGGAVANLPVATRAQQRAVPVVGYLGNGAEGLEDRERAFRNGLSLAGYVEGRNVTVEYHHVESQYDRVPALMADLIRRRVAVIVASGNTTAAIAAKAAPATIPIIFGVGDDPVKLGLVASLARPGGNVTGVNFFVQEVVAKRLGLLHQLVSKAVRVAVLLNPANTTTSETILREVREAAAVIGLPIHVHNASTSAEIDAAFTNLGSERLDALFVAPDGFFNSRPAQFATLAARDRIPAAYGDRAIVAAGGLISYGTSFAEAFRQIGIYTGSILKGAKPMDLPVMQSTRFEFAVNLQTARLLGIEVPPTLLAIADEVIE